MGKIAFRNPNNCYILNSSLCCEVVDILNQDDKMMLCRIYRSSQPLFREPCDSRMIGAYAVHKHNTQMKSLPLQNIESRAVKVTSEDDPTAVFFALLHDF